MNFEESWQGLIQILPGTSLG